MKTLYNWPAIADSIEVLISYKKGNLNLTEANTLFSQMTGLESGMTEKFLQGMSRTNVKKLTRKECNNV